MKKLLLAVVILLTISFSLFAQDVEAITHLGTKIVGKLKTDKIVLNAKHGKLEIPPIDIESIKFGYHVKEEMKNNIEKWTKELDANIVQQRELAHKNLIENFRYSALVLKNIKHKDREVSKRIETILTTIAQEKNNSLIPQNYEDIINLWNGEIYKGVINNADFLISSEEVELAPIDITTLKSLSLQKKFEFTLSPSECKGIWFDTGITINRPCKIRATGELDMRPGYEEKHVCGPTGFSNVYGQSPSGYAVESGKLVAMIGIHHVAIGNHFDCIYNGKLFLFIGPAPRSWEAPSATGSYKITIE